MENQLSREDLINRLIKAGELEVLGANQVDVDAYFDMENFVFHGPGSFESDYAGLPIILNRSGLPLVIAPLKGG